MATASQASAEGQDVLKKDATYNFDLIQISETAMRILQGRLALFVSGAPKFDTLNLGVQLADWDSPWRCVWRPPCASRGFCWDWPRISIQTVWLVHHGDDAEHSHHPVAMPGSRRWDDAVWSSVAGISGFAISFFLRPQLSASKTRQLMPWRVLLTGFAGGGTTFGVQECGLSWVVFRLETELLLATAQLDG